MREGGRGGGGGTFSGAGGGGEGGRHGRSCIMLRSLARSPLIGQAGLEAGLLGGRRFGHRRS